ncbi:MAG: metal-dependent hydrolase [Candidatus Aenigmarchaeota archaeon]|nr:metal-dependent hydrolase [Candidatus Aenigmarchaeota archaeon]
MHTVLIAGIAGLLPDIDIPINWILGRLYGESVPLIFSHGGITHTPFFGLIFLIPAIFLWKRKKHRESVTFS